MQGGGRRRESGGGGSCAGDGGQKQPRSRLVMTAGELSAGDGWGERRALSAQNREMASPGRCCSNHANSGSVQRRSASLPAAWTLGGGRVEDVVATRGKCASWRQESCERDSRACVSCVCVPGSVCVCQEAYCSRRVAWRCGGGILRMQKCVPYCCCVCARACGPKARGARREATDRALSPKVVRNAPQNRSLCRGRCGPSRGGAPYIHARGDPAAWSAVMSHGRPCLDATLPVGTDAGTRERKCRAGCVGSLAHRSRRGESHGGSRSAGRGSRRGAGDRFA